MVDTDVVRSMPHRQYSGIPLIMHYISRESKGSTAVFFALLGKYSTTVFFALLGKWSEVCSARVTSLLLLLLLLFIREVRTVVVISIIIFFLSVAVSGG